MAFLFLPGSWLALASGLAMAVLGAMVFRTKPRPKAANGFSAFAMLWGSAVVAANLAELSAEPAQALAWKRLEVALGLSLYLPLLFFVSHLATHGQGRLHNPLGLALVALPAAISVLLFASAPRLFVSGAYTNPSGLPAIEFGPLFPLFVVGNSVGAFAVAFFLVERRVLVEQREATRSRLGLVSAALGCYLSFRGGEMLSALALLGRGALPGPGTAALAALALMAAGSLAAASWLLWRAWRRPELPWRGLTLACAGVPFVFGILERLAPIAQIDGVTTVGLWRLAMVAIFSYAILRYRIFDVEVRVQQASPAIAYSTAALVTVVCFWKVLGTYLQGSPGYAMAATAGLLMLCAPAARLGRLAVDRAAPQLRDPDYLYKRKVDVYRAALEEAQARGMGQETEQHFLSELRRGLGISDAEHRILLMVIQSQEKYASRALPAPASAGAAREKFHIVRELGRGSFGRAVLARDTVLDRDVVLKQPVVPWLLDAQGRELFVQEARLAARIQHPNVIAIHDVLPEDDPPVIVMEHVAGGSLEGLLAKRGRLPPAEARRLMLGVLSGLEAVHGAGIVHRDLKPANVLIAADGTPKVTDFGIATPPPGFARAVTITAGASQPGSLAYMSPEQARGDAVDERTDVYAAGAILHRMLTGRHYFELSGSNEHQVRRHVQETLPRFAPGEAPPALEAVVRRALAKEKEARFPSAAAMAEALRAQQGEGAARRVPVLTDESSEGHAPRERVEP